MTDRIQNLINNLKHLPGVYLMHDKNDRVIYVGKAKDLYKRVSQYFLRPQTGKVFAMVRDVSYFETIIVKNEKEAFVLEMNLIQTYYPKYNILLKDGSHYPYIALKKGKDPILTIKRNSKDKNYDYYGPFPSSGAAYEVVDLLNKIFPLRKCKNIPSSPCLYYHLGTCLAPCINQIDDNTYDEIRNNIKSFLNGDNAKIKNEYINKMNKASDELDYESAKEYKKIIDGIEHINTSSNVEMKDKTNRDLIAYSKKNGYLAIAIFLYRKGILLGKQIHVVEEFDEEDSQVEDLISEFYLTHDIPSEIIINNKNICSSLSNYLNAKVYSVTKGKLNDLLVSVKENADNALDEYFLTTRNDDSKLPLLEELGELIHIVTPLQIDLFDNSHIQGSFPIGAMVTYINGERCPKLYRKFNIEHAESRDDTMSMKEVLTRHYSRLKSENKKYPDLILLDGGLTQVKAGKEALKEIEVDIPLFGLYKNDRHQTEGLIDVDGNTYPIENKALFFLLTRMQDEIHRFAITFHISKRDKAMTVSILDDIKGLGIKRKENLLRAYPDINLLKEASIEELSQIVPNDVAILIKEKINN